MKASEGGMADAATPGGQGRMVSARLARLPPTASRMRIVSFNANGIRSAANKGFFPWLEAQQADIVCLQET